MSRCIIHVGMRKTGTKSIQQSLNGFSDATFVYANINGQPNHGAALYSLFANDPGRLAHHVKKRTSVNEISEYIRTVKAGLAKTIEQAKGKTIIFSGEVWSYSFTTSELEALHSYFADRFEDVEVVAYIRQPAAYMVSNFQQRVKHSAYRLDPSKDYFNYQEHFSRFDEVFGRENVRLWKFDPQTFPGGCAVRDFCNRLGIEFPAERIVRVNESISREAVGLLFTYRKLGKSLGSVNMTGPQNYKLVQQVMGIGNSKFRFSPDIVRPVLEKNRADIEWMEARLGQSLAEELGEHRPDDVRDEADLLTQFPDAVSQLLALVGDRAPFGVTGEAPEQVALLVHALRDEGVPGATVLMPGGEVAEPEVDLRPPRHGATLIRATELVEQIRRANPKLLEGIPTNHAAALVRNLFRHMNESLAKIDEGVVSFAGLGQFRVRKVEKEVGGEKIVRTQTVFRKAMQGQDNESDGVGAGGH